MKWFKFRNWKCIRVTHYLDISFSSAPNISKELRETRQKGFPSTDATYICTITGKVKTESYYNAGYLTIEELNCAYKE